MVNRISAAGLHVRQYFHRDTDDALDLCDILGSYARGAKAKLDEVSKILGLTGKPEGIDGSKVGEMVAVGQIDEVARYCKSDVLNTFPVWLVYESFRGAITEAQLEWSEAQIRDFVAKRKSGNPHLLAAVGMATNFPRQGCGLSETVERWEDAVDACGVNVMQYAKTISLSAIVCLSLLSQEATATPFWSVYWINEPQPCIGVTGGLGGPVVSSYYEHCVFEGTTVSICRNTKPNRGPWEEGQAITIVGYSLNMILSSPTSPGTAVVGQYGGKGADVFGETSGVGSNSRTIFFHLGSDFRRWLEQKMPTSMSTRIVRKEPSRS
jgi:hypothetical protein